MGYEWLLPVAFAALRGIEPYEVMQALYAPRRRPVPATSAGIGLLTIWARTRAGRPLVIVLRHRDGRDWWIVGAHEMDADELAAFKQWEANDD